MLIEKASITPASAFVLRLQDPPIYKSKGSLHDTDIKVAAPKPFNPFFARAKAGAKSNANFSNLQIEEAYDEEEPVVIQLEQTEDLPSEQLLQAEQQDVDCAQITTSSGNHNRPSNHGGNGQQPRGQPGNMQARPAQSSKPCDAEVLRGSCYAHQKGTCPYSHTKADIEAARRRYLSEWKTERSDFACLTNTNLLTDTFGRDSVVNSYDIFQANAESYQAQQNLLHEPAEHNSDET